MPNAAVASSGIWHAALLVWLLLFVQPRTPPTVSDEPGVTMVFAPVPATSRAAPFGPAEPPASAPDTPPAPPLAEPPSNAAAPVSPVQPPAPAMPPAEDGAALPPPPTAPAADEAPKQVAQPPAEPPAAKPAPVPPAATATGPPPLLPVPPLPVPPTPSPGVPASRAVQHAAKSPLAAAAPHHLAAGPVPSHPRQPDSQPSSAPDTAVAPMVPPQPVAGTAGNRPPAYPDMARQRRQQGTVVLRVDVSADGIPLQVEVLRTSGHASLDSAAVTAVRQWRFKPATRGGVPVIGIADIPIQFRLEG